MNWIFDDCVDASNAGCVDYDVGTLHCLCERHRVEHVTFNELKIGMQLKVGSELQGASTQIIISDNRIVIDQLPDDGGPDEPRAPCDKYSFILNHGLVFRHAI